MGVRDSLLPDFDHEMAVTRRVLERVPEHALAWRPHEKSFDLGGLALHLAVIPRWGRAILQRESYDLAESSGQRPEGPPSCAAILETFDRHVAEVRRELVERSDAELMAPWKLLRGGQLVMSLPRIAAFRSLLKAVRSVLIARSSHAFLPFKSQVFVQLYCPEIVTSMVS